MKSNTPFSFDIMWKAIVDCDSTYDGQFFYAVKTTGIFCRPSCKSKTPKYENIFFFENVMDAKRQGFRACKRCQPELCVDVYNPQQEIVNKTVHYLYQHFQDKITLNILSDKIGISPYYLIRIFKEETGLTPLKYLEKIRIHKAQNLLLKTVHNSTEICFQVGYRNFSSFYRQFKKISGCSPSQFKNRSGRDLL